MWCGSLERFAESISEEKGELTAGSNRYTGICAAELRPRADSKRDGIQTHIQEEIEAADYF